MAFVVVVVVVRVDGDVGVLLFDVVDVLVGTFVVDGISFSSLILFPKIVGDVEGVAGGRDIFDDGIFFRRFRFG